MGTDGAPQENRNRQAQEEQEPMGARLSSIHHQQAAQEPVETPTIKFLSFPSYNDFFIIFFYFAFKKKKSIFATRKPIEWHIKAFLLLFCYQRVVSNGLSF